MIMEYQETYLPGIEVKFKEDALRKVIDVGSDPEVVNHVTPILQVKEVLREGLINEELARRIKKVSFRTSIPKANMIMFNTGTEFFDGFLKIIPDRIGIIVRRKVNQFWSGSYYHGRRIPPREFIGLLLNPEDPGFDKNAEILIASIKDLGTPLPIYSTTGDLIWPRQMSRNEIVQMLSERGHK